MKLPDRGGRGMSVSVNSPSVTQVVPAAVATLRQSRHEFGVAELALALSLRLREAGWQWRVCVCVCR